MDVTRETFHDDKSTLNLYAAPNMDCFSKKLEIENEKNIIKKNTYLHCGHSGNIPFGNVPITRKKIRHRSNFRGIPRINRSIII